MIIFNRSLLLGLPLWLATATSLFADREILPLVSDWRFTKANVSVSSKTEDWDSVIVPHTWNVVDGESGPLQISDRQETAAEAAAAYEARNASKEDKFDRAAYWYQRGLEIPAEWKGQKRVFIRFEAASMVARTYINKTMLGEHRGGFTAFCYELTDHLKYGEANELRVQVDNSAREDLPPLGGDFNIYGGIYRPVQLIVTDLRCITPLDFASPGVYLTTQSLDDTKAVVEVRSMLSNGDKADLVKADKTPGAAGAEKAEKKVKGPRPASIIVLTEIKDASGATVAKTSSDLQIQQEETVPVVQTLSIANPHRWNGRKDPYLYTATVSMVCEGKTTDQVSQQLGLRSMAISQEQGFVLNGKPYPVHGVNRHQDLRGKGWAVSPQDEETDAAIMAEMGVTAVRNAHYPQSENWHQINDRAGVLLWDELSLVGATRSSRAFWLNSEEDLREMIHQLYNHPSIAWWGIFNELENHPTPPSGPELAHLQAVAKEIDSHRIVLAASCHSNRYINHITEEMAFNTYPGWYGDEKSDGPVPMGSRIETRAAEVGKRIAISEYGAGASVNHHIEGPPVKPNPAHKGPFHPEEWQAFVHEQDWLQMKDNSKLWGTFLWNMFDFAAKGRNEGAVRSVNDKGLVTHDRRFKKDAFYMYKANWNSTPMVYIASRRSIARTQPSTEVKVYSNCKEVELKVNGKSCGMIKPDGLNIARWPDVKLRSGENTVEAISKFDGKKLSDACKWTFSPAS